MRPFRNPCAFVLDRAVADDERKYLLMTRAATIDRVDLPQDLHRSLRELTPSLPPLEIGADGLLRSEVYAQIRAAVLALPGAAELGERLLAVLGNNDDAAGFAVLSCRELVGQCGPEDVERSLTALMSLVGHPLRVFDKWPLWKPLGTNLTVEPMRAMGVGYNPMHIDVVNSTRPPDLVALLCVRPDPLGEGYSLVASLREAVRRLPEDVIARLAEPVYRDGAFYDLSGVGEEYAPFPIIDGAPERDGFVRFTAKMLVGRDPDDPYTVAARALEAELLASRQRFLLGAGEVLVVNQHLVCHGREALGDDQVALPPERRRLLKQIVLRCPRPGGEPAWEQLS